MCQVLLRVLNFAALKLRIDRQRVEPQLRRVPEDAHRRSRVGKEKPGPLLVVADHLRDPVGPSSEELRGQAGLECLHRRARFEPASPVHQPHAQHRRPWSLADGLDGADRSNVRADPHFDSSPIHSPTRGDAQAQKLFPICSPRQPRHRPIPLRERAICRNNAQSGRLDLNVRLPS